MSFAAVREEREIAIRQQELDAAAAARAAPTAYDVPYDAQDGSYYIGTFRSRQGRHVNLRRIGTGPVSGNFCAALAIFGELIDRLADQAMPNLDAAIENGLPISFATTRLTALVHNAQPRAVAYVEIPDSIGLMGWLLRDQLLAKINAGFDEIADDKAAFNQAQREEAEARINSDMLATERLEVACIWAAEARREIIDFRPTTSPQAVLGVSLRTVPRAAMPPTSLGLAWDHASSASAFSSSYS